MSAREAAPATRWQGICLVVLAGLIVIGILIRVPSIAEPLAVDQGLWASAARAMARGQLLYRDVFDQKPPGLFLAYLAAFRVFGWIPAAVGWLDVIATVVTTAFLFAASRRVAGRFAAAIAAALFSVLSAPAWLFRYGGISERSIAETFIMSAVAFSAWCATRGMTSRRLIWPIGVGFGVGAAMIFKPNAGVYLPALLLWMAAFGVDRVAWRPIGRALLASAAGLLIVPGVTLLWLWHAGVGAETRVALLDFNRAYVAEGFAPRAFAIDFAHAIVLRIKIDPLWTAGAVGAAAALWDGARRRRLAPGPALAFAWAAAGAAVIAVNGARLYPTYFVQVMPPLALLGGWWLASAGRAGWGRRIAVAATGAAMIVLLMGFAYLGGALSRTRASYPGKVGTFVVADVLQLAGQGDRQSFLELFEGKGGGYSASANEAVAAYLRARTTSSDRIYQFGINFSGVYFATDRLPANKFLRVNFFVPSIFPAPDFQLPAVVADVAARRPVYLIFEHLSSPPDLAAAVNGLPADPSVARLLSGYRLETTIEDFTLYRRID